MTGISLVGLSKHFDWRSLGLSASEAVAQVFLLNANGFSNAISAVLRGIFTLNENDPVAYRAKVLVFDGFVYAWTISVLDLSYKSAPTAAQTQDLVTYLISHFEEFIDSAQAVFERRFLQYPEDMPLFSRCMLAFTERLRELGCVSDDATVRDALALRLREGMNQRYLLNFKYFDQVEDFLTSELHHRDAYEICWKLYNQNLIQSFENARLIGEEDRGGVTLAQVYQPLRSVWEEWSDTTDPRDGSIKKKLVRQHIYPLDDEIDRWLSVYSSQDCIRLISGGPGSGKSTFSKKLAAQYAQKTGWRTVFVPLQRIASTESSLGRRIEEYFRYQIDEPFGAEFSPFNDLSRSAHDWLVIFDGLDELAGDGKGSDNASQEFASALNDWKASIGLGAKVRFVVLGRAPSMQDARQRLGLLGRGTLFVQDMVAMRSRAGANECEIVDPGNLAPVDQRSAFWARYAIAKRLDPSVPEAMTAQPLNDLTKEPLLAYLIILSGYVGANWKEAADNRNRIYAAIFNKIWDRERIKPTRAHLNELGKEVFDSLLQTLGLAAWQGAGRTGDERAFLAVKQNFLRPNVLKRTAASKVSNLENTAILFYTRRDESGNAGFEFLHKSFGEYLTAEALVTVFIRWTRSLISEENEISAREFLRYWNRVASLTEIDEEILTFARNEFRLQLETDSEAARNLLQAATGPFDIALKQGFSVDAVVIEESFVSMESKQATARINLLAMLSSLSSCAYSAQTFGIAGSTGWTAGPVKVPYFRQSNGFAIFVQKHSKPINVELSPRNGRNIRYWCYQSGILNQIVNHLDLSHSEVIGLCLSGFAFSYANLESVNFINSRLENCSFHYSSLTGAKIHACLVGALFTHSMLASADFSSTILRSCFIIDCDLTSANFSKSKFESFIMDVESVRTAELSAKQRHSVRATQLLTGNLRNDTRREMIALFKGQPLRLRSNSTSRKTKRSVRSVRK